jgi:hypothetical protein
MEVARCSCGQEGTPVRVVNLTGTDLSALAYMRHLWSQVCIALRWF